MRINNTSPIRHAGWLLLVLFLLLAGAGFTLQFLTDSFLSGPGIALWLEVFNIAAISTWVVAGAVLISRQPWNPISWIFSITPFLVVMDDFAFGYAYYGSIAHPGSLPGTDIMIVWLNLFGRILTAFAFTLLLSLFPTGRPPSEGWWKLIWLCAAATVVYILSGAISSNPFATFPFPTDLFGIGSAIISITAVVRWISYGVMILCTFAAIISLYVRYLHGSGIERQQLKWFVFAAAFFIPSVILILLGVNLDHPSADLLQKLGLFGLTLILIGIPISSAIAILRYRLWDIDIIIRRTLVYGLLTGSLAIIYFFIVIILQQILQRVTGQQSPLVIVLSTLVIAALFSPLRRRIQEFIDQRFYRRRYDAAETLARFALKVQDEVILESLVEELLLVVHNTMNPESLSIWLKED